MNKEPHRRAGARDDTGPYVGQDCLAQQRFDERRAERANSNLARYGALGIGIATAAAELAGCDLKPLNAGRDFLYLGLPVVAGVATWTAVRYWDDIMKFLRL